MIKTLLTTVTLSLVSFGAIAADLPKRTSAATPAPVFVAANNWTGFYAGVVGGYVNGKSDSTATGALSFAPPSSVDLKGALVGGQVGYNHQFANGFVLGVVADVSWSGAKGTSCVESSPGCDGSSDDSYSKGSLSWLATVRAKAGLAVTNDVLIYATGGLAMAGAKASISHLTTGSDPLVSDSQTLTGWVVGGGIEYKLSRSVSVGAEYLYADFGKQDFNFTNAVVIGGSTIGSKSDAKVHIVRASLNYRF